MSGDWIKMRGNLWDDPRVGRICDLTSCREATAVGALYWLWAAADQHTEDGCMPGLSMQQIDRKTGVKGFAAALVDVGWLTDDPRGVVIQHFEEHNGASAKKRAQTAKRVSTLRSGNASETLDHEIGNAPSVTTALARDREEKRREDQETSKLSLAPTRPLDDRQPTLPEVDPPTPRPRGIPDCPHKEILALWAEVLPALPQHDTEQWRGARADHLRARWRETAVSKGWLDSAAGLAYFRKLFGYVGQSQFLTGRAPPANGKRPFAIELEWLVSPLNWAKVIEGKYHQEVTA